MSTPSRWAHVASATVLRRVCASGSTSSTRRSPVLKAGSPTAPRSAWLRRPSCPDAAGSGRVWALARLCCPFEGWNMGELVKHGDGCPCTGCTGFLPGHTHSTKHGAYASSIRLSPRTEELAAELREVAPLYSPADEVVIRLFALVLARIELAAAAIDRVDEASAGR